MKMKELTHRYYEAWAVRDRAMVRELLHEGLVFTSPQDKFASVDSFLVACWHYSKGLAGVYFVKEVYEENSAFVILQWLNEDGSTFTSAEYLERADGKIIKIIVVNNDPLFEKLIG